MTNLDFLKKAVSLAEPNENVCALIDADVIPLFTEDDLDNCWQYYKSYLIDILNGDYDLNEAREDLMGLINSKFDKRTK